MYSLRKVKNNYKVETKKSKNKGWIISSWNHKHLAEVANNLKYNVPKLCLKRVDVSNISLTSTESREDVQPNINISIFDDNAESQIHEEVNSRDDNNSTKNMSHETSNVSIQESNVAQQNNNVTNEIPLHTQETPNQQDFNFSFSLSEIFGPLKDIIGGVNDENDIFDLSKSTNENISFKISDMQQIDQMPSDIQQIEQMLHTQQFDQQMSDIKQIIQGTNEDSDDYNADPDYDIYNDSGTPEDSDNEANSSIASPNFCEKEQCNSINNSLNTSKHNYEGKETCDDNDLIVHKTEKKGGNKKYFCMYCKKLQTKFARHLETVHKNEADVKKFILLPKGNLERRVIIDTIRKQSNFEYNTSSQFNTGELIVSRRPTKTGKCATDFACCPKCKGYYTKNNIRHHFTSCNKKSIGKHVLVLGRKVQARIHYKASDAVRKVIFPIIRDDDISRIIRYDELVILRANKLSKKFLNQRYHDMIRAELRLLGRFLISIKQINSDITDFASIYVPRHYDSCVLAAKDVAQFDPDTNRFKTPSVATRLGTLLKKLGKMLISECIKKDDSKTLRNTENFLKLLEEDYGISINKTAEETITQNKRHKNDSANLPTMDDIQKLYNYLKEKRIRLYTDLIKSFNYNVWLELLGITLISIQVYNRRRAGEIEKVLVEDYKHYKYVGKHTDPKTYDLLTEAGKKAIKKFVTFDIRGKLGRTVPVLLHSQLQCCIELLLQHRSNAKVEKENPYLFGIPGYNHRRYKHLKACQLMREFSANCGAQNSLNLRGTKLRKHIATKCIGLNLSDAALTDFSDFMGHDKKIHKTHYRLSVPELDIPRFSRILNIATFNNDENENDEEINENVNSENLIDLGEPSNSNNFGVNISPLKTPTTKRRSTSPFGSTKRKRWTLEETEIILNNFHQELENSHLPSGKDIELLRQKYHCLQSRTVPQIKTWLHNILSGKTKIPRKLTH